jgi:hypothetical protein
MIRHNVIRPILAVGIPLILLATLICYEYKDLAETDFLLPHHTFENIDEECPPVYDADSGDRLGPAFFSILPEPHRSLLKEDLYPLPDMAFLCPKSLVLRC